jgi:hypothetical protein
MPIGRESAYGTLAHVRCFLDDMGREVEVDGSQKLQTHIDTPLVIFNSVLGKITILHSGFLTALDSFNRTIDADGSQNCHSKRNLTTGKKLVYLELFLLLRHMHSISQGNNIISPVS